MNQTSLNIKSSFGDMKVFVKIRVYHQSTIQLKHIPCHHYNYSDQSSEQPISIIIDINLHSRLNEKKIAKNYFIIASKRIL